MAIKEKAKIIEVNALEIPEELKELPNWVLWRAELDNKRNEYKKVPYSFAGYRASSTNDDSWTVFDPIYKTYEQQNKYNGIGFVLSEKDDYVVLDIDNAIDDNGQLITDLANDIVQITYCEISPSGTGVHCFFKGQLPSNRKKKRTDLNIELYDKSRFMTVTGESIGQSEISEDQSILDNLVERYFKQESSHEITTIYEPNNENQLSDDDVIKIMLHSKQNKKINDLLIGKYESYFESPSEAVQSLLHYLAFYTGKNSEQMERIFLNYNNLTDKWHSPRGSSTWGQLELEKAIANQNETYQKGINDFEIILSDKESVRKMLNELGSNERLYMEKLWIEEGEKGRKPTVISPNRCAHLLKENLKFILFDLEENTKLAMYRAEEGIYTQNVSYIKRVISWLEPKLNSNKADEVIYHLKNRVDIKSKTNSPDLIPVKNGVFNRKTKQLEPFTPEYVFTTKINTAYKTQSGVPVIEGWSVDNWINEIACNDHGVAKLLWQVINDSLNGNYTRKKAIFLVGDGNNGKGTFQELISQLIGAENIASLKVNEFDERFKLSVLEGKTAVIGDDVPVGVYIDDSSNFKSVVTGDPVLVEFKNQPLYRATFKCTVIQSTNGMPSFKDKTSGTLRRLLIVPFNANFNGQSENFNIKEQYVKNQKVLEYVLYRSINMDFDTFDIPEASNNMLDIYKQDNDPVYDFKVNVFDEWIVKTIPKKVVYYKYKEFCENSGYTGVLSDRKFYKSFEGYLGEKWDTDDRGRFSSDDLSYLDEKIGYFNKALVIPNKQCRVYRNENLKIV
ncbi:TPA: DNA primase [Staphylococcus pseudintermedius]|nr:DNA primase [Staphylococcus pseudintermedius]EGQ3302498.1 DNA primase [Staphylococcus pseudintermedius]HDT8479135.1 DNA primase [Staphylococcus pseudintermedius]